MTTRPKGGAFSAIPRCFSLKYTKYSSEKAPCLAKKFLALGHIAIFQTRPELSFVSIDENAKEEVEDEDIVEFTDEKKD